MATPINCTIPCRIGDVVWVIKKYNGALVIRKGIVSEIFFVGSDMQVCIVVERLARGVWGETVFETESEALAKLRTPIMEESI